MFKVTVSGQEKNTVFVSIHTEGGIIRCLIFGKILITAIPAYVSKYCKQNSINLFYLFSTLIYLNPANKIV